MQLIVRAVVFPGVLVMPVMLGMVWAPAASAAADAPAAPPASPKAIRDGIDAAAKLLAAGQQDAAVTRLAEAVRGLDVMAALPRLPPGFKPLADRATAVRRQLEQAGVDVAAIAIPDGRRAPAARPAAAKPVVGRPAAVSFSRQVAPILAKSCGGCHVTGRKGDFQMASYEGLMRSGMVQRGQGQASRLVEVILTGDMPRGGGRVSSQDVATLVAWIDAGAACDAANPAIGIDVLARGGGAAPPPAQPPAVKAVSLKPGEISFAADVAPLLQEHCLTCHGGDETENNLSMATLQELMKGGRGGVAVAAGKGADSLLVKKLRGAGIDGQRMPLGRPPLPDDAIATIEKWIDQGARLDMLTATTPLDAVVSAGQARKLSDAALAKLRFAAGEKLWRRAIPDEEAGVQVRPGVCVVGNLPAERLAAVADVAADVTGGIRRDLSLDGPLLKGGVVIFAVRQAIDYSALWQNISNNERPRGVSGHAGVAGDVVYGALLVPASGSADDLRASVAEVVAAAAFAGRSTPAWFSQGAGRAVAGRLAPQADVVAAWRRDATAATAKLESAGDFLADRGDPAVAASVAGAFVGGLGNGSKLGQVAAALDSGAAFAEAFLKAFRVTPVQAFEKWAARPTR